MPTGTPTYIETTAAFAVSREFAPAFDLAIGIHPDEQRWLTEDEERDLEICFRYCDRFHRHESQRPTRFERLATPWLTNFPQIRELMASGYEAFWQFVLDRGTPLALAYAFYPTVEPEGVWIDEVARVRREAEQIQREMERPAAFHTRARGNVVWTFPFPLRGPLGQMVEGRFGLTRELKQAVGLSDIPLGLIAKFLIHRGLDIQEIHPHNFAQLTGALFEEEGWDVTLTPRARDGGKDAILAKRESDGRLTTVYLQAKRYSLRRRVGLAVVKEFVATVAADNADEGILVTTSHFSKPAMAWLSSKGRSLATVQLVDREEIENKIRKLAGLAPGAYRFR